MRKQLGTIAVISNEHVVASRGDGKGTRPVIPSAVEGSRGATASYATGFLDFAALRSE
jgi:hypothetical protein